MSPTSYEYVCVSELEAVVGLKLTANEVASLIRLGLFPSPAGLDPARWEEAVLVRWRRNTLRCPDGCESGQGGQS